MLGCGSLATDGLLETRPGDDSYLISRKGPAWWVWLDPLKCHPNSSGFIWIVQGSNPVDRTCGRQAWAMIEVASLTALEVRTLQASHRSSINYLTIRGRTCLPAIEVVGVNRTAAAFVQRLSSGANGDLADFAGGRHESRKPG